MAELLLVHLLSCDDQQRAWAAISGQTTHPVVESIFSVLNTTPPPTWQPDDFVLVNHIRKEILDVIATRNRIAHDVWSLGEHPNRPLPEGGNAERIRFSRSSTRGAETSATPVTIDELRTSVQTVARLRSVLSLVVMTALPGGTSRPTDVARLDGSMARVN